MTFERWFLASGIALCLFSLWAIGRHDWLRLVRPSRRITASVTGHRESWENSSRSYAAIYAFTDETGQHEVIDAVHKSFPLPETGARVPVGGLSFGPGAGTFARQRAGHPMRRRAPAFRAWDLPVELAFCSWTTTPSTWR